MKHLRKKPRIRTWRVCDPKEAKWVVYVASPGRFRACAPHLATRLDRYFGTLHEALDYARSQQPLEAP